MAAFRIVLTRPRLSQAKLNARRARRLRRPGNYPTRAKDSDHRVLGFDSPVNLGFLPGVASDAPSVIRGYSIRKISPGKCPFFQRPLANDCASSTNGCIALKFPTASLLTARSSGRPWNNRLTGTSSFFPFRV